MNFGQVEKECRRTLLWVLVYLIPAFQAMLPVEDPDLWWHLRTAQWIVEHGQVPMVDPFSTYGMGKPWVAYSWLFELIAYGLHSAFGLAGIVGLTVVMSLLIALVLHTTIQPAKLPFVLEIGILAVALGSLKPLITPRSWLFSILFFAIELRVLFYVRRTGKSVYLWALPPLFALWANFHIQFLYGLAAIGFFLADIIVTRLETGGPRQFAKPSISIVQGFMIAGCCGVAVLVTPYHYHILRPIIEISTQTGAFFNILELHPMSFRTPADWLVLALTLAGFYVLGWEQKLRLFPLLLIVMGSFLSFRARRDVWVVVLAVVAIASEFRGIEFDRDSYEFTRRRVLVILGGAVLGIFLIGNHRQMTNQYLQKIVEQKFPVRAVQFVRDQQYAGPLFNNFDWGGYLIWGLPHLPVSIDNRMNVHGDLRIERSLATWAGTKEWSSDSELITARLVVAEIWRPLVSLLRADPRFRLVYEDSTAAVFVRMDVKPSNLSRQLQAERR
jgi:hypothetical protein